MQPSDQVPDWVKTAKAGDKIVCIKDDMSFPPDITPLESPEPLIVGAIYTISSIEIGKHRGAVGLVLVEVVRKRINVVLNGTVWNVALLYGPDCFRPLTQRPTDISVFTQMLNTTPAAAPLAEPVAGAQAPLTVPA